MKIRYIICTFSGSNLLPISFKDETENEFKSKKEAKDVLSRKVSDRLIESMGGNSYFISRVYIEDSETKKVAEPPKFPLNRVINDSNWRRCDKCGSSMTKRWFSKKICDNRNCI